jgi:hypothetical protein
MKIILNIISLLNNNRKIYFINIREDLFDLLEARVLSKAFSEIIADFI